MEARKISFRETLFDFFSNSSITENIDHTQLHITKSIKYKK